MKGSLLERETRALDTLTFKGWLPRRWADKRIAAFWERQASSIHEQWGRGDWDFELLGKIIQTHCVSSILDIGCGSGRLFPLYRRYGINRVLGIDISAEALAIARRDYPDVFAIQARIEEVALTNDSYDLIVSNRVLQHIPTTRINQVVKRLCTAGRLAYLNELSESDGLPQQFFMVRHDYETLFGVHGWQVIERGLLGNQTYLLFRAPRVSLHENPRPK
jgi:SAM-dependent methyltransferase